RFGLGIAVSLSIGRSAFTRRTRAKTCKRRGKNLIFSASTRACPPNPQAHSSANRPELLRRNILLDSDSDHSAGKALCSPLYRGCDLAGRVTPARAPHPPAKDRSLDNTRFRSHPG